MSPLKPKKKPQHRRPTDLAASSGGQISRQFLPAEQISD